MKKFKMHDNTHELKVLMLDVFISCLIYTQGRSEKLKVIYDHLGKYDLFGLAVNDPRKVLFYLIIPTNQYDG